MSAIIPKAGPVRQLDRRPEPDEQVTEEHAKDPARVARLLMRLLRDVATMRRRWWPRRVDHEDRAIDDNTGATLFRFPHGFGGRVRWWVVDWSGSAEGPQLVRDANSDSNTLVLVSYAEGTATIRIEASG